MICQWSFFRIKYKSKNYKKIELLTKIVLLKLIKYLFFGGDETLPSLAVKLEFITNKEFYQKYKKFF